MTPPAEADGEVARRRLASTHSSGCVLPPQLDPARARRSRPRAASARSPRAIAPAPVDRDAMPVAAAGLGRLRVVGPVRVVGVVVPAAPRLSAEPSGGHHPRLERARPPARLAEATARRTSCATSKPDVDPHEVHQLERAHPEAAAEPADAVDLLVRGHPLLEQPQRLARRTGARSGSRGSRARRSRRSRACPSPRPSRGRPRAPARRSASAAITSSSRISGGGLKKCMPTTFSGCAAAPASEVTRIDDVFVASTVSVAADLREAARTARASARAAPARPRSRARTAARSSSESATRSRPAPAARPRRSQRPRSAPRCERLRDALDAALERLGNGSCRHRRRCPARQPSCAMPAPIVPAPTTPIVRGCAAAATRPLNSGLRFSRNAVMPSTRSSVAIASSKRRRSCSSPALSAVSSAASTACLASRDGERRPARDHLRPARARR